MSYDLMDDLFNDQSWQTELATTPFHEIKDKKDKKELVQWLQQVSDALIEQGRNRTRRQRENLFTYRGVSIRRFDRESDYEYRRRRISKIQRFIVNHLYDLTETKVAQMTRLKPAVEVLPNNDEWRDRASAKVVQHLIKHLWYINNIDDYVTTMHRHARIFGESYCFVTWDETKGDLHPAYVEARDMGLTDSKASPLMTGDVCYEIELPWRVFLQRARCFEESEYLFRMSTAPVKTLKKDYPKKAKDIQKTDNLYTFDTEEMEERYLEEHTVVIEFFHKKTKHVPEGAYIKFTNGVILEQGKLPYSHGQLPCVRHTDLDVPDVLNGVSRYETVSGIQNMYNNLSTLIVKNIYLMAHSKWVMPRGAAKIEQLGNDHTIVQYQGPVPPQMIQTAPNPPEVYAFRQQLVEDMQTIYGNHGISRGEVPKGITAATALQFLNELEAERSTTDIAKHGFLVQNLAKMTVSVAGDNYDTKDGRMVRIVGENNQYLIRHFDAANLHKSYDIRFDNSSGLPETKAAKTQRILDAMQRNPEMVSGERWEELLELANTEKMVTIATAALQAADSENEDLLAGRPVADPEPWEDHIAHWESHSRVIQGRQFKEEVDPSARAAMLDHLRITELAMFDKAQKNPEFSAKLATLTNFPINQDLLQIYPVPNSREHQEAIVQGQANKEGMTDAILPGVAQEGGISE
jgi:hypothetical protein